MINKENFKFTSKLELFSNSQILFVDTANILFIHSELFWTLIRLRIISDFELSIYDLALSLFTKLSQVSLVIYSLLFTLFTSEWSQFFVVSMKKKPPDRSSKLVRWWWWWWITRSSNNRVPKFFNICHKNYDKKMKRDIFSRCSQILSSGTFQIKWKNISFSKIKRYFVTRSCYKISMRYSHKHYLNHKQN